MYEELSVMFKSAKIGHFTGGLRRNTFSCLDMVTDLVESIKLSVPWEPAITLAILRFNSRLLLHHIIAICQFHMNSPKSSLIFDRVIWIAHLHFGQPFIEVKFCTEVCSYSGNRICNLFHQFSQFFPAYAANLLVLLGQSSYPKKIVNCFLHCKL